MNIKELIYRAHHKFDNGMVFDYTLRYHYANSGSAGPYLTNIEQANATSDNPQHKDKRFFYVDNPNAPYTGLLQNGMMIVSPQSVKNTVMARLELNKKSKNHHWMVGFHNWYYNVDKANTATYNYQYEVAPNPRGLLMEQYVVNKDGDGNVVSKAGCHNRINMEHVITISVCSITMEWTIKWLW